MLKFTNTTGYILYRIYILQHRVRQYMEMNQMVLYLQKKNI